MKKSRIEKKLKRKTNRILVETIIRAKKKGKWAVVANMLSIPRRKKFEKNLDEINRETKEGDTVVVPGKVLGKGNLDKKIKICAFAFSAEAVRKLKDKKCEIEYLGAEINKNPKYEGVRVLR